MNKKLSKPVIVFASEGTTNPVLEEKPLDGDLSLKGGYTADFLTTGNRTVDYERLNAILKYYSELLSEVVDKMVVSVNGVPANERGNVVHTFEQLPFIKTINNDPPDSSGNFVLDVSKLNVNLDGYDTSAEVDAKILARNPIHSIHEFIGEAEKEGYVALKGTELTLIDTAIKDKLPAYLQSLARLPDTRSEWLGTADNTDEVTVITKYIYIGD